MTAATSSLPIAMPTAHAPTRQETSAQAIEVLRHTKDGDDLAPRHLSLLQYLVNKGPESAPPAALAEWQTVVADVKAGRYSPPWFHGVKHLTRDHEGYVHWKGAIVEHYSFTDSEAEGRAARRLGAACLRLEALGIPVRSGNLMNQWDQIRAAEGMDTPRYLFLWSHSEAVALSRLLRLQASTAVGMEEERHAAIEAASLEWKADTRSVRYAVIVTQEDFKQAETFVLQGCESTPYRWTAAGRTAGRDLMGALSKIPVASLPYEDAIEAHFLWPHLKDAVAAEAAASVARPATQRAA